MIKSIIEWVMLGILLIFILRNLFFAELETKTLMQSEARLVSLLANFLLVELLSIPLMSLLTIPSCNEANAKAVVSSSIVRDYKAACKTAKFSSLSTKYTELIQVIVIILTIVLLKRLNFDYRLKGLLFGAK